jgi:hypothetical protein
MARSVFLTGRLKNSWAWIKAQAGRLTHLWAIFYFTTLSLVMTWPLALHFNQVVGGLGDNAHFIFLIRWNAHVLTHPGTPFYHIPWLNYPAGWNLASTDMALASTLPGVPLALLFGDAVGFNFAMLFSFVFSGWAMFAWVRRLTGSLPAAFLAGTLYTFMPYRLAHYHIGHLNLSTTQYFPLFFWGLHDLLSARRWAWKPALLAGISLGLIAHISMYYLYMTALVAACFVLGYFIFFERRAIFRPMLWLNGLAAGIFSLPLVALGVYPFLSFSRGGGLAGRSVDYAAQYSASPTDFLLPFPGAWLWSGLLEGTYQAERWIEQSLSPGLVALVLALLAWRWVRNAEQRRLLRLLAVCSAFAFILALGVRLNWWGQPVLLDGQPIPMPAVLLFEYAPFFDKMRALARFGFFVPFFAILAAGLGAAAWFERLKPRFMIVLTAGLIGLALLDSSVRPAAQFTSLGPRPVDRWLAAQPGAGALAVFPFHRQMDQDLEYYAYYHGKPYIGGFYSANVPDQFWLIQPALDTFPSPQALEQLRALDVAFILVEEAAYPNPAEIRAACRDQGLILQAEFEGVSVYGLPAE